MKKKIGQEIVEEIENDNKVYDKVYKYIIEIIKLAGEDPEELPIQFPDYCDTYVLGTEHFDYAKFKKDTGIK